MKDQTHGEWIDPGCHELWDNEEQPLCGAVHFFKARHAIGQTVSLKYFNLYTAIFNRFKRGKLHSHHRPS